MRGSAVSASVLCGLLCIVGCGPGGDEPVGSRGWASLATSPEWRSFEADNNWGAQWGDADSDGWLDLVVAGLSEAPNRLYLNEGGALEVGPASWSSPDVQFSYDVAWGDWDADGDLDLAVANGTPANQVFENEGAGVLTLAWTSNVPNGCVRGIAWADWDADGDLDLAMTSCGEAPTEVFANNGTCNQEALESTCLASAWTSPLDDDGIDVQWADVNGDGFPDLSVGNTGADHLYINDGSCALSPESCLVDSGWEAPDLYTHAHAWGDWDRDGDLDLAAAHYHDAPDQVFVNDGTCSAAAPSNCLSVGWTSPFADGSWSVAWGNWDGDNDLDLGVSTETSSGRVFVNSGGGCETCMPAGWESDPEPGVGTAVRWGDWDNDGDVDRAETFQSPPTSNRVYVNEVEVLTSAVQLSAGDARAVAWGDWDGDGDLDLAVGNSGTPIEVFANAGGVLSLVWTASEASEVSDLAWGDWDGDGDLDLAVANLGAADRIYVNDGAGAPDSLDEGGWESASEEDTWQVRWTDWDGDGDLDLAVGRDGVNAIYRNDGGLDPEPPEEWKTAEEDATYALAVGDLDGDGDPDLVAGNGSADNRIYLNEGDVPTLLSSFGTAAPNISRAVALGDYDGNGTLDLALGDEGPGGRPVTLYTNDGDAGFTLEHTSPISGDLHGLAWGDFDGNGVLELAVSDAAATTLGGRHLSILDASSGSLEVRWISPLTEPNAHAVAPADVDGDGDLDLALGTDDGGGTFVYLNHRLTSPMLPNNPTHPRVGPLGATAAAAAGVHSAERLDPDGTLTVAFTVIDAESDPAPRVRLEYSLALGAPWQEAALASTSPSPEALPGSPLGTVHELDWDVGAAGLVVAHDDVRIRVIVPWQSPTFIPFPIQHGALAAVSPSFRLGPCDEDNDGSDCTADCDDTDAGRSPLNDEVLDDGIDQDCNDHDAVTCREDLDGDGYPGAGTLVETDGPCAIAEGVEADCDDSAAAASPGNPEELCDGIDTTCAGEDWDPASEVDGDLDGVRLCDGDCDDGDDTIGPDQAELCDGRDTDCDGVTPAVERPEDDLEACLDGADNDCDGLIDGDDPDCEDPLELDLGPGCACAREVESGPAAWVFGLPLLPLVGRRRRGREDPEGDPGSVAGRWGLAIALSALSLNPLTPGAARAAAEDGVASASPPTHLVLAADPESATALVKRLLPRGASFEVHAVPAAMSAAGVWSLGPVPGPVCPTPTLTAGEVEEALRAAQGRIDEVELEDGGGILASLRMRLGCLESPADGQALWRLHFLEAVAAHFGGNPDASAAAMLRALAVRPGAGYDSAYPPALRETYLAAQKDVMVAEPIPIRPLGDPAAQGWDVFVDGVQLPAAGLQVIRGEHLLQFRAPGGVLQGATVLMDVGDVTVVGLPRGLSASLAELDVELQSKLAGVLSSALGGGPDDLVWVVDEGDEVVELGHAQGKLQDVSPSLRKPPPVLLIGVGGGYQRLGRWNYGTVAVDASVRIVGPLRLQVHGRVAIGPSRLSLDGRRSVTPTVVPFGLGPALRFNGRVHFRTGALLQLAYDGLEADSDAEGARLLGGVAGFVGVDLPLPGAPIAITPSLEVGFLGPAPWLLVRGLVSVVVEI